MSKTGIQLNILCANEFSLIIALTVFVMLTVILALMLIFLAASKNFRTVFFREKPKKKKRSAKKQHSEPEPTQPQTQPQSLQAVDTIPIEDLRPKRVATRRNSAAATPEYLNAIPTVPLGGAPVAPAPAKSSRRAKAADVEDAQTPQESGSTYVTRSITITRARSSSATTRKSNASPDTTPKQTPKKR